MNYSRERCEGEKSHYDVAGSLLYSITSLDEMMGTKGSSSDVRHLLTPGYEYFTAEMTS